MRRGLEYFLNSVQSLAELPPSIGEAVQNHLADADETAAILIIPPQKRLARRETWRDYVTLQWRKTPQRTLVFAETRLILVEADRTGDLTTIVIPLKTLVSINLTTILLCAYLELTWIKGGYVETCTIEFNTVDQHAIREQIKRMLAWIATAQTGNTLEECDPELAKAEINFQIRDLPLKFRNYLRGSLLPGEHVRTAVYQPPIRQAHRLRWQTLSPGRVLAFTDQHLILLEEDIKDVSARYSIRTVYYPIQHIQHICLEIQPEHDAWDYFYMTAGTTKTDVEVRVPLDVDIAALLRQSYPEMVSSSMTHLS